jgi:hypothetical protein
MVGDYISSSFSGTTVNTLFTVGLQQPSTTTFDEAMYAPSTPLAVATPAQATNASSTAGVVVPVGGAGTGATHQAIRRN